ncbi:hypothetical protein [Streptomyces melanogenes]|uniref:hypothetical protein n=1 Tax=Streptomyces melanogenes TaxID=67326 RepID=UPI00167EF9FF|nr:hypothetical protein [Streptomyces melanogenes]GGP87808.1 hypothetical protein GCM10010278_77940 [Streptomyces melanogenes]
MPKAPGSLLAFGDRLLNRVATAIDGPSPTGSFSSTSRTPWWRRPARHYRDGFERREERREGHLPAPTARPMGPGDWPPA